VLEEHWFITLQEAQVVIKAWRREYNNEERPQLDRSCDTDGVHLKLSRPVPGSTGVNFVGRGVINGVRSKTTEERVRDFAQG